jgi:hypothetical protein
MGGQRLDQLVEKSIHPASPTPSAVCVSARSLLREGSYLRRQEILAANGRRRAANSCVREIGQLIEFKDSHAVGFTAVTTLGPRSLASICCRSRASSPNSPLGCGAAARL